MTNHNRQNNQHANKQKQGKTQIPQPDLRLTIRKRASDTATNGGVKGKVLALDAFSFKNLEKASINMESASQMGLQNGSFLKTKLLPELLAKEPPTRSTLCMDYDMHGLSENSLMPVGWPLHLDGAVKQWCTHRTATFQELLIT